MRTTRAIKDRLVWVRAELDRINTLLMDGGLKESDPFFFSNGEIFRERTFKESIIALVSERTTLEWVLNKKN